MRENRNQIFDFSYVQWKNYLHLGKKILIKNNEAHVAACEHDKGEQKRILWGKWHTMHNNGILLKCESNEKSQWNWALNMDLVKV